MTSDFEGFSIPDFIHYIYFPILIIENEPVLNKGTTGTIFITSLVWRGPWLGIEPGPPALKASTLPLGYRGIQTVKNPQKQQQNNYKQKHQNDRNITQTIPKYNKITQLKQRNNTEGMKQASQTTTKQWK